MQENSNENSNKKDNENSKPVSQETAQTKDEQPSVEPKKDVQFNIEDSTRVTKNPFKFKTKENGKILTVHHTKQEHDKVIRTRLGVCCFAQGSAQFVAIDKKGNVFVFDMTEKKYWRPLPLIPKASIIKAHVQKLNQYFVGTKLGQLLLLDIDKSKILTATSVSDSSVTELSYPPKSSKRHNLMLVNAGNEAILVNIDTFTPAYRLDFDKLYITLKFASYLPHADQIFTCFTNDSVQIWSAATLGSVRKWQPIKMRNHRLESVGVDEVPELSLLPRNKDELQINGQELNYANGLILAYCYSMDAGLICMSTLDAYLLIFGLHNFELQNMFRLRDFVLTDCVLLPKPRQSLLLGRTYGGQIVLLDLEKPDFKMIVQRSDAVRMSTSRDGKLLAVVALTGEVDLWSLPLLYNTLKSQEHCVKMLRDAFKQHKHVPPLSGNPVNECFNEDIKKLLKRDRLLSILKEYGCYPTKYRYLIWCALLQLPCNQREFQLLLRMEPPELVRKRAKQLRLKNEGLKRRLAKIWSCLAHWCKVFAHSDFIAALIFPFVKLFPKNALITFEICATLLTNHFQLWFEFHPLEPSNYLGMCDNVLQHFDAELSKFYSSMDITAKEYAWSMLSNAFSEVLDEEQWMCLWDHIMSHPVYFPIFCVVAYNILQREVILRLPDKAAIAQYFHEQNPVNVPKVLAKAISLMQKCPPDVHPQRYIKDFEAIPKHVYPKFLNYPQQWVAKQEHDMQSLQQEHHKIDAHIRALELEEEKMRKRLAEGLKEEEHEKRMKEMERQYQETLRREEERIACQRKVLLAYQTDVRNRKGEILATLRETERRKEVLEREKELNTLLYSVERERRRQDSYIPLAENELRNQELENIAQQSLAATHAAVPLTQKYTNDIRRVADERKLLKDNLKVILPEPGRTSARAIETPKDCSNLDEIERIIDVLQDEIEYLIKSK